MTSRQRVVEALTFGRPDRAPRDLWVVPGVPMFREKDLRRVLARFPSDIVMPINTRPAS